MAQTIYIPSPPSERCSSPCVRGPHIPGYPKRNKDLEYHQYIFSRSVIGTAFAEIQRVSVYELRGKEGSMYYVMAIAALASVSGALFFMKHVWRH